MRRLEIRDEKTGEIYDRVTIGLDGWTEEQIADAAVYFCGVIGKVVELMAMHFEKGKEFERERVRELLAEDAKVLDPPKEKPKRKVSKRTPRNSFGIPDHIDTRDKNRFYNGNSGRKARGLDPLSWDDFVEQYGLIHTKEGAPGKTEGATEKEKPAGPASMAAPADLPLKNPERKVSEDTQDLIDRAKALEGRNCTWDRGGRTMKGIFVAVVLIGESLYNHLYQYRHLEPRDGIKDVHYGADRMLVVDEGLKTYSVARLERLDDFTFV